MCPREEPSRSGDIPPQLWLQGERPELESGVEVVERGVIDGDMQRERPCQVHLHGCVADE